MMYADNPGADTAHADFRTMGIDSTGTANAEAIPPGESVGPLVPGPSTESVEGHDTGSDPFDFHRRAKAEFAKGDYRKATYFAAHAAIDEPRNPKTHLLYSLGLFALGEYRGAAVELHAVMMLGSLPDWITIYTLYGSAELYAQQLRALERHVGLRPTSPEGHFLLGFHYLMIGHPEEAKVELLAALKLAPRDRLAAKLLTNAGGQIPPEIAKQLADLPAMSLPKSLVPEPPEPHRPPQE
jgi:tetratricopeptide (TPR) repeat protein